MAAIFFSPRCAWGEEESKRFLPSEAGEVARRAGGVMSFSPVAHDPSVRCADTSPRAAWGGEGLKEFLHEKMPRGVRVL